MTNLPALFISHGAPDLPIRDGAVTHFLKSLHQQFPKPQAILVISAHWNSAEPTVSKAVQPRTIHDFGGFPDALYRLSYPAPGAPILADRAGASSASFTQLGNMSGLAAFRYTVILFEQVTAMLLREAPAAISVAGVELLLVDRASFGGGTVADFLEIPFISVCCALMLNREPSVPPMTTTWSYSPALWAQLVTGCRW